MRLRPPRRAGLSLLEVIVSMAVFLFALVSLGFLLNVSGNMAMSASAKSHAAGLAQTILAEAAAGAVALEGQSDVPFDDDPDYTWSLQSEQGGADGLYNVTVTVSRTMPGGGQTVSVSLSQMILDPAKVGTVYDTPATISEAEEAATTATESSTTSQSSSSSSTTQQPAGQNTNSGSKNNQGNTGRTGNQNNSGRPGGGPQPPQSRPGGGPQPPGGGPTPPNNRPPR